MAGELLPRYSQVVPSGLYGIHPHEAASQKYHISLLRDIEEFISCDESEVEIAHIVVDGTAAGQPASQIDIISFDGFHIAFAPRVLVAPYNDSVGILPQIQQNLTLFAFHRQMLFECEVFIWVGAA